MPINLILGPMKSGKTTEMLRLAERHEIAGKKVCILRPEFDNRGTASPVNFSGVSKKFVLNSKKERR